MTFRKVRIVLIVSALILLGPLGVFFASRGLRVEITNATPEPLVDVELTHPGGIIRIARIEPGRSAAARIRGPLGFPPDIPIALHFSQQGQRSLPLALHCQPRSVGWRTVTLNIRETPVHRSVVVSAGMVSLQEVNMTRLGRNTLNPKIGPRAFMETRSVFCDRTVIPRRNWVSELATAFAALLAPSEQPIRGTIALLDYSFYATSELLHATRSPDPHWPHLSTTSPVTLPIDWRDASQNGSTPSSIPSGPDRRFRVIGNPNSPDSIGIRFASLTIRHEHPITHD